MKAETSRRLAWSLTTLSLLTIGFGLVVGLVTGSIAKSVDSGVTFSVVFTLGVSTFAVMGVLVSTRQPSNPIGWLFGAIGMAFGLLLVGGIYADAASLPGREWAAWATNWAGAVVLPTLVLVMLLFPEGRLLSRRWRLAIWIDLAGLAFLAVGLALTPGPLEGYPDLVNPIGVEAVEGSILDEGGLGWILVPLAVLAAGASLILRFRRSRGVQRQQLKWLAFSAVCVLVGFVANEATYATRFESIGIFAVQLAIVTVPLATGAAILRYRLYDIDLVINKALVYGSLATFITVVYVAIVLVLGTLSPGGEAGVFWRAVATAVVALAFQPVRERVQRFANRLVFGKRASPYEVMAGFARSVADTLSVDEVLPGIAEAAARGVGAPWGRTSVRLPRGDRSVVWPSEEAEPQDGARHTLEVTHQGEPVGSIEIAKPGGDPITPAEERLLADLASQAGLAMHNARLTLELQARIEQISEQSQQLRRSRERLVTARDVQRKGLERDIHEGPERQLLAIGAKLHEAVAIVDADPGTAGAILDELGGRTNDTLEGLRDLARGIFPPLLADEGIVPALEAHIRKVGANAEVRVDPGAEGARFDADLEACVYFCCVQAIQNVIRHAGNAPTVVRLRADEEQVTFQISDRGPGFDTNVTGAGMGVQIMRDRIDALEGELTVRSTPGEGTAVTGRVPARALEAATS